MLACVLTDFMQSRGALFSSFCFLFFHLNIAKVNKVLCGFVEFCRWQLQLMWTDFNLILGLLNIQNWLLSVIYQKPLEPQNQLSVKARRSEKHTTNKCSQFTNSLVRINERSSIAKSALWGSSLCIADAHTPSSVTKHSWQGFSEPLRCTVCAICLLCNTTTHVIWVGVMKIPILATCWVTSCLCSSRCNQQLQGKNLDVSYKLKGW